MPKRLLSRDHVVKELKKRKCRQVKAYETATAWETASGIWFVVPHETREMRTDQDTLNEILASIETLNVFAGTRRL